MSEVPDTASAPTGEAGASEPPAAESSGSAEVPRTRQVDLDWEGLARALLRPAAGVVTYLDTQNGEVVELIDGWSQDHGFSEQELAEGLVSGRLITIEPLPEQTVYGWMSAFTTGLEDGWARDALQQALAGLVPMRSFEETLGRFPRERLGWLARREAREAAVLRAWLEAKDISPTTERRRAGHLLT